MFHPRGPTLAELLRQALCSTRRGYDLLAPKFDHTPFRTPHWLLAAVAPHLGSPGSVARGLDLCCGTGAALPLLLPLCRELVVGVDFSFGMLAEARRERASLSPRPTRPRVLLLQQDVLLPGLSAAFDLAVVFGALGHIRPAEQDRFLAAARDCLAPGGRLAFVTAALPPPWSPSLWLAAGFDLAMWARNVLWRPPFVMYYLAWPLHRSVRRLTAAGFSVELRRLATVPPAPRLRLLLATAPGASHGAIESRSDGGRARRA